MKSTEQVHPQIKGCSTHSEKNVFPYYASSKTYLQGAGEMIELLRVFAAFRGSSTVHSIHTRVSRQLALGIRQCE